MRLRTTFGFERFMATKKKAPKAEEPKEEVVEAPKEEVKKAAPKKAAPKALKPDLSNKPDADLSDLELEEFILQSYASMLGRKPLDMEMEHHIKTVTRHKRPRSDIHIDITKGGEYQGLWALKGEGTLLGE
ncbi:hypothetical protein K0U83_01565 [bacterium]|nr:hypothetical protein [bacterium]